MKRKISEKKGLNERGQPLSFVHLHGYVQAKVSLSEKSGLKRVVVSY